MAFGAKHFGISLRESQFGICGERLDVMHMQNDFRPAAFTHRAVLDTATFTAVISLPQSGGFPLFVSAASSGPAVYF